MRSPSLFPLVIFCFELLCLFLASDVGWHPVLNVSTPLLQPSCLNFLEPPSTVANRSYVWAFSSFNTSASEFFSSEAKPKFAFSWFNDKDKFQAGQIATVRIKVLENFDKIDRDKLILTLTVNGKTGNSSFISGVLSDFGGDPNNWSISFTTISVGLFNVMINEDHLQVFDSSLHFLVVPGKIYPSASTASWTNLVNEFDAGTKASISILPKDAFGNNISSVDEPNAFNFTLFTYHANNSIASLSNTTNMGWNEFGYINIEFVVVLAGNFLLHVECGNQTLREAPLSFEVNPGPLEVSNCVVHWDFEPHAWQLFSKMEIFVLQRDKFGNFVPGLYAFDAEIVNREKNLSIPVSDLHFREVESGIQLFSFTNLEAGNFLLTISDVEHNIIISNMPYAYTVYIGYCDGLQSVVNGTGINNSVAGELSEFYVYLNDVYQYPSPIELQWLRIQIVREIDVYALLPSIHPINGSGPIEAFRRSVGGWEKKSHALSGEPSNVSASDSKILANAFDVIYTPDKSGVYSIFVFSGNILLNGGHSIKKEVASGGVNISLSGVVKFSSKVPKLTENEIVVQLMDSFWNPVLSQQSKLKLDVVSFNRSGFINLNFVDNNNGSYTGYYTAKNVGTYEICASFDGKHLSPCPFRVNVYGAEYFPNAFNDTVSVWEDESIAFDILANDYFAGDSAIIVSLTNPNHGSLIQYERLVRYTPYKDYYGIDFFTYVISDINGNLASASVSISVLSIPPQIASFPSELQATEDIISPRIGGFPGFEIRYSDGAEKISVNVSAHSGSIFLSPILMQFDRSTWCSFSVSNMDEESKDLNFEGCLEVINTALQSIQYLGKENFCGTDTIRVSTRNKNGMNTLDVPIFVEPINDVPYIQAPEIIILKSDDEESLIFDKERDKYNFFVGDPDIFTFPGGEANFMVIFSMEVNDGNLVTNLPAELINTTELKLKNSQQWQPLQTYVSIAKHFTVKAKGIRFRGTLHHCNDVMQKLVYRGRKRGTLLTMTVNDMGNYGCYPDCTDKMSVPLFAEATIQLIRRKPMTAVLARSLGSAIAIEFVVIFTLAIVLIFFTCKCAILLVHERTKEKSKGSELPNSLKKNESSFTELAQKPSSLIGCIGGSSSFMLARQFSDFRHRCRRQRKNALCGKAARCFHLLTGDNNQLTAANCRPLTTDDGLDETV